MAEIYLTPQDVSASDTLLVLAFLNSVTTADEIASGIEIPNELDIGVNLGQRLLDARAEYGGAYISLDQLMAVPLIGPERFTEIVTVVTGKSALEIATAGLENASTVQMLALTSQFNDLKRSLDSTEGLDQTRYRIELNVLEETPFLGEIVNFKLKVVDRFRQVTKANMPVTIETNWGILRHSRGYKISQGSVFKTQTGVDGQVQFQLYTPTSEPLTVDQQSELCNALAKLSDDAQVPNDARRDFVYLTSLYKHPLNRDLRDAVDIHYKSRQDHLVNTLNMPTSIYSWSYEQALVRVYLHPHYDINDMNHEKSTVLTMAAMPIEYRDWLAPWYQIYKEELLQEAKLSQALAGSLAYSEDENGLASQMISNVQSFISGQNGLLGERAGQQVSNEVITRLMTDNLSTLTNNTRATLYSLVNQAPDGIQASGKGSIAVANQVSVEVGRKTGVFDKNLALAEQLSQLEQNFSVYEVKIKDIEARTGSINFDQLFADLDQFNNNYASFDTRYSTFDSQYTSFNVDYTVFNRDYSDFKTKRIATNTQLASFSDDLTSFNQGISQFNQSKDQLVANVTEGVNDALRQVQATSGTRVTIKPIESVNLKSTRISRPRGG